ncbi:MAG: alpha/beta fold hydrolase [Pirellulales bacterium]|nr:alpha/beta fold hydrolase [Pirellulales bacterium]
MRPRFTVTIAAIAQCAALIACAAHGVARGEEPEDPRRPAAVQTEGVPVVPVEVFERLRQYQNVRTATFAGWAPDGRGVLVATRFGNATQLHRVYDPGGRREQITFFDEPTGGQFVPQATDGAMLAVHSQGGDENDQVYLIEPAAGRSTLLTDGHSRNLLGPVRDDGTQMIVHSNRRNGRDTDLYVCASRQPGPGELLLQVDGQFWQAADWSRDGGRVLLKRYVSINEAYPAEIAVDTRKLRNLPLPDIARAAVGDLRYAHDDAAAFITTDARGEFLELARLDLATGRYTWLADDLGQDVDSLEVDRATGRLAFTTNDDGASRLFLWQAGERRELKLPLGIVGNLEFSPDGSHLGFTLARPAAPADAYSVRVDSGELTRWTYSEVGGLNPERFVTPERIKCPSFDQRDVPAYLYLPQPPGAGPAPVLILIHGGPESQYRPLFSGLIQYWVNEQQLAVICPNVRGSAGYGKTYLQLDNGPNRETSVRDIGAVLDYIAKRPELDAGRVGVMGGSYGGYMVLASLAMFGERLRAGIDQVGIANFISFLEQTSPYRQDLRRAEYGDERDPAMRQVFERINPTNNAERIRAALLVSHGVNDPRVPFGEAQQIAAKVRAAGQPVWTVYADNEGHGFAKKDNRDYLTAVEAMFLERYLIAP